MSKERTWSVDGEEELHCKLHNEYYSSFSYCSGCIARKKRVKK